MQHPKTFKSGDLFVVGDQDDIKEICVFDNHGKLIKSIYAPQSFIFVGDEATWFGDSRGFKKVITSVGVGFINENWLTFSEMIR